MLLGSIGFSLFEYLQFGTFYSGVAFLILTASGWLFRKRVMEFGVEYGSRARTILVTYGLTLFLAKSFGASDLVQLCAISLATTVMFNLNLWSLSEAILVDRELELDAEK